MVINSYVLYITGVCVSAVGWDVALQVGRWRIRFPKGVLRLHVDLILRSHYAPGIDSTSNRKWYQKSCPESKGGWCVRLTTLPPSCSECLNILESSIFWSPRDLSRHVQKYLYLSRHVQKYLYLSGHVQEYLYLFRHVQKYLYLSGHVQEYLYISRHVQKYLYLFIVYNLFYLLRATYTCQPIKKSRDVTRAAKF
jgi:hypothetical protein